MNTYFLVLILFLSNVGNKLFSKACSNIIVGKSYVGYTMFMTVNGIIACAFFLISGKFHISCNLPTLMYSVSYAFTSLISNIFGLIVYKLTDIAGITVIRSALGLIASFGIGVLLFNEKPDVLKIVCIFIMITAILLCSANHKKPKVQKASETPSKKISIELVAVLLVLFAADVASTLIIKYYAISSTVTDENSLFFLTNAILVVISGIVMTLMFVRDPSHISPSLQLLRPRKLVLLSGNTVCCNIGSLMGILLIAQMDVSIYSPVQSAIGILSGVVASIMFREKLGVLSYLGAALACSAVIII